jgi:hypothetical protein
MASVRLAVVAAVIGAVLLTGVGCGGGEVASTSGVAQARGQRRVRREAARRRAVLRHRVRVQARKAAIRRHVRQEHRAEARKVRAEEREARQQAAAEERELRRAETAQAAAPEEEASECDPNYSGACLMPDVSDYDCEGGSGNGPYYTGEVTVVGVDHYGLDANGNGIGCEAE